MLPTLVETLPKLVDTLPKLPLMAAWLVLTLPRLVDTLPRLVFVFDNVVGPPTDSSRSSTATVETLVRLVDTLPKLPLMAAWLVLTLPRLVDTLVRLVFVFDNVVGTTDRFESVVELATINVGPRLVETFPRLELIPT